VGVVTCMARNEIRRGEEAWLCCYEPTRTSHAFPPPSSAKMHRKHWYHRRTKITHSHYPLPPCVQNPFNTTTPYTYAGPSSLSPQTTYSARRAPLDSEVVGGWGGLDRTSPSAPTASAAATGEAGDDDVEDRNDAGDNSLQDGTDAVDNGHETGADGLENGLDLE